MLRNILRRKLMLGSAFVVLEISNAIGGTASAQSSAFSFDLPSEPLARALHDYAQISGEQVVFSQGLVAGKTAPALRGQFSSEEALNRLLAGSDLVIERSST